MTLHEVPTTIKMKTMALTNVGEAVIQAASFYQKDDDKKPHIPEVVAQTTSDNTERLVSALIKYENKVLEDCPEGNH